jgi:hypothetical protein
MKDENPMGAFEFGDIARSAVKWPKNGAWQKQEVFAGQPSQGQTSLSVSGVSGAAI